VEGLFSSPTRGRWDMSAADAALVARVVIVESR
jgi:hypothetical protein